jgi:hypothetical protein
MLLCDTSVVDWDAVGALGTWAVGIAAIFLAWKANGIASDLKAAEQRRSEKAARAIAAGLRIEILTYLRATRGLAARLESLAMARSLDVDVPGHAAATLEAIQRVEFSDKSAIAAILPHMPEELASKISSLHAVQRSAGSTFATNLSYWKEQSTHKHPDRHSWRQNLSESSSELGRLADKVEAIADAISDYLGVSPEDRKRALLL